MTVEEMRELEHRRAAYREAFERWSAAVRRWRSLAADRTSGDPALARALRQVNVAQAAYSESRDRLVECLLGSSLPHPSQVRAQAHALWEAAGRPTGNPEEHWYRAEAMLQSLRAAAR